MSRLFNLDVWFGIVERGTSGDQVYDILYSWKVDRDALQAKLDEMTFDCASSLSLAGEYGAKMGVLQLKLDIAVNLLKELKQKKHDECICGDLADDALAEIAELEEK